MGHATIRAGNLTAVIGDNAKFKGHRAGYNGVWSLTHSEQPESPFVPPYAGLNLEHIFDGKKNGDTKVFFEPRHAPMTFRSLDETAGELHQPPTPTFHLESTTTFRVTGTDYLDMTFRCAARRHVFEYGYIGLFWASYIHAPEDKSIYFLGGLDKPRGWQQHCTPTHNNQSTVRKLGHATPLTIAKSFRDCLYRNYSPLGYEKPFFYGHFRNMTLLYMFDLDQRLRITHSPSGGGYNVERATSNPAWDFQFVVPKYDVNIDYGFRARLVYRPRMTRQQILDEFEAWSA